MWLLALNDGSPESSLCDHELADYRAEVRKLTLGEVTDVADDYRVFAVRVDYKDGRPPKLDSEVEIDDDNGKARAFIGLP